MNTEERIEIGMIEVEEGNSIKGIIWAILLSVPLWTSFFGWIELRSSIK